MTKDKSENLFIKWTASGKIDQIFNSAKQTRIDFGYDPMGNRISKTVVDATHKRQISTLYVRDAQGNTLAVYEMKMKQCAEILTAHLSWQEQHLYGSARVGMYKPDREVGTVQLDADLRWLARYGDLVDKTGGCFTFDKTPNTTEEEGNGNDPEIIAGTPGTSLTVFCPESCSTELCANVIVNNNCITMGCASKTTGT